MNNNTAMIGLNARASVAAGTGQNLGAIDLPIMREAPTDYPVVFGSAVKGALRAKFETEIGEDAARVYFGDDAAGGSAYAGALIVSDARLLLLPVRSLTGHFKRVTCPYLLHRFRDDLRMLGQEVSFDIPAVKAAEAVALETKEEALYLEEFMFRVRQENVGAIVEAVSKLMEEESEEALKQSLVIVSDDMFTHLSRYATPVNAHIAIDNETKTVKNGALWYEESLPPETLLYTMLIANASRKEGDAKTQAEIIRNNVVRHLRESAYLQLGGNETVGMGWCKAVCHA